MNGVGVPYASSKHQNVVGKDHIRKENFIPSAKSTKREPSGDKSHFEPKEKGNLPPILSCEQKTKDLSFSKRTMWFVRSYFLDLPSLRQNGGRETH